MSDFATGEFATGLLVTAATVVGLLAATFLLARRIRLYSIIDVAWGLGFVLVAVVSFAWSSGAGDPTLRAVMLAVVAVWGVRLTLHLVPRMRQGHEDRRYARMFERARGSTARYALVHVYVPQGLAMWFVSLPVQVAMYQREPSGIVPALGVVIWLVGLGFESVADVQLRRFSADPGNRTRVMDRGLWRFTRHPNYFGDACVWWGIFLVACGQWEGLLTVGSPALMTWTLAAKTGKPMLEHGMEERRPGYADYVRRTSAFVPLPPRAHRPEAGSVT